MSVIVALDIETTGIDPQRDSITEIGAVKFNGQRIEGEWSSLINPERPIPPMITQLTGISNAMVSKSPTIHDVIPELTAFIGEHPILGHNVKFDINFLNKHNILEFNDFLDTYEIAAVLLPSAGRYNLSALAEILHIPAPTSHRALADAQTTRSVYLRLFDIALDLPIDILAEIVRLSENVEWGAEYIFHEVYQQRIQEKSSSKITHKFIGPIFTEPPPLDYEPLFPLENPVSLDTDDIVSYIEYDGAFSKKFPQYEYRHEQVELCRAITKAINLNHHLLAEAGTGVGKSIAYLIPAATWALKNNTRVVISTNTINLQDQLITKDIPDIQQVLGNDLHASILKGRNNYICPRRLQALRRLHLESVDEIRVLAKVLVWLRHSKTGDLSEINITGPNERAVWSRISANDEGCTSDSCVNRMGGICPFYRAKQAALQSHLLVVNHALLLADVATGNRVLPDFDFLIVDEAHHLEDATTNALSFKVTQTDVDRIMRELGSSRSGILGSLLSSLKEYLDPGSFSALNQLIQKTTDYAFHFQNIFKHFFTTINYFLEEQREGRFLGSYPQQVRVISATRSLPSWSEIELVWEDVQKILNPLLQSLEIINRSIVDLDTINNENLFDLISNVSNIYHRLFEFDKNITGLVFEPSPEIIYWIEVNPQRMQITLEAAPLHIGDLMEMHLWHKKSSVILTSATLTTGGSFQYIRNRLNAWDADEIALGSPYDFENSTLLYLPNNIPEPQERVAYQRTIEHSLINLCKATNGRTLALFTSYTQLQATSNAIRQPLSNLGISVYEQGQGASPHSLLETFKSTDRAVLLGTRAFWEGVDIPGEALSILAIIRLPFSVPTNPIVAARSETFDNPFYEYSVPEANNMVNYLSTRSLNAR
jgi:ATP-dependent DNA helicase DinG